MRGGCPSPRMNGEQQESSRGPAAFLRALLGRLPWWFWVVFPLAVAIGGMYGGFPSSDRISVFQAIIQGLVVGSIYVLGASGLSLTYGIKKFANFALGDMMTVGAYMAFTANVLEGLDILWGFLLAMITVALLGMFLELAIFRRLEKRGEVAALIASVGVSLILQNAISAFFFTDVHYLNVVIPQDFEILNTGLTFNVFKGGLTIGLAIGLMVFLHVLLKYTTLGKAMRACADDLDLARTAGISTHNVILWTWAISGAFAGIAGVLLAIIVNVYPLSGFFILLFLFASVIVGGIGSPYGAMAGGFIIGVVEKLSNVLFGELGKFGLLEGGAAWEPAGAFIVLILVLLIKPDGLMGRRRAGKRSRWLIARKAPKEVATVGT